MTTQELLGCSFIHYLVTSLTYLPVASLCNILSTFFVCHETFAINHIHDDDDVIIACILLDIPRAPTLD